MFPVEKHFHGSSLDRNGCTHTRSPIHLNARAWQPCRRCCTGIWWCVSWISRPLVVPSAIIPFTRLCLITLVTQQRVSRLITKYKIFFFEQAARGNPILLHTIWGDFERDGFVHLPRCIVSCYNIIYHFRFYHFNRRWPLIVTRMYSLVLISFNCNLSCYMCA